MLDRKRRGAGLIGLTCLAAAGPALAAGGDCLGYGDLGAAPALGRVAAGAPRVPFVQSASARKGCPGPDAACRENAFLVPGDTVILGAASSGFVCATYVGAKGAVRSGWLPENAVARAPDPPAPALRDWTGTWSAPEAMLVLRPGKADGTLAVEGNATFGLHDPDRVRRGAVNLGEVGGTAAPSGSVLAFTMGDTGTLPYTGGGPGDCRIRLRLLPPFLLAEDNGACGGMNVSFTNVYRRSTP